MILHALHGEHGTLESHQLRIALQFILVYLGSTEYVRPEWEPDIRKQVATYKQFTRLVEQWIALGIERSKLRMQIAKQERSR